MTTNASSPLQGALLNASRYTDAAGNTLVRWTLALGDQAAFQDVDQWGLPYDGSSDSALHDDLCDWLAVMGRVDTDALNAL